MSDYIALLGAEQVQSAANSMRQAAYEMQRAASNIDYSLTQHQQFLTNWLQEFAAVVDGLKPQIQPAEPSN